MMNSFLLNVNYNEISELSTWTFEDVTIIGKIHDQNTGLEIKNISYVFPNVVKINEENVTLKNIEMNTGTFPTNTFIYSKIIYTKNSELQFIYLFELNSSLIDTLSLPDGDGIITITTPDGVVMTGRSSIPLIYNSGSINGLQLDGAVNMTGDNLFDVGGANFILDEEDGVLDVIYGSGQITIEDTDASSCDDGYSHHTSKIKKILYIFAFILVFLAICALIYYMYASVSYVAAFVLLITLFLLWI